MPDSIRSGIWENRDLKPQSPCLAPWGLGLPEAQSNSHPCRRSWLGSLFQAGVLLPKASLLQIWLSRWKLTRNVPVTVPEPAQPHGQLSLGRGLAPQNSLTRCPQSCSHFPLSWAGRENKIQQNPILDKGRERKCNKISLLG